MTVDAIKQNIQRGKASLLDVAQGIRNDRFLLFNFFMDNNPEDVNVTLREDLGNKDLPLRPSRKSMETIISGYLQTDNTKALQKIINEFDYDPNATNYTTNPKFLQVLGNSNTGVASRLDLGGAGTELGTGIGGFLGPVFGSLGSNTTTTQQTTQKTSSMAVIVVVGVIVVLAATVYFLFFNKSGATGTQTT